MATTNIRSGSGMQYSDFRKPFVKEFAISTVANPMGIGDTLQVWDIPADTYITAIRFIIDTAETTGSPTLDIGDTSSATLFMNAANPKATAGTVLMGDGADGDAIAYVEKAYSATSILALHGNTAVINHMVGRLIVEGFTLD